MWEKFQEAIQGAGKAGSPLIKKISAWAKVEPMLQLVVCFCM